MTTVHHELMLWHNPGPLQSIEQYVPSYGNPLSAPAALLK